MLSKSIIIVGAGIAGLSAGCYAQMNGYESRIFELHNLPGGLCTSWKRKDYIFDGCINWLVGSGSGTGLHKLWEELGALKEQQIVNFDEFTRIVDSNGKTLIVYTNVDLLENHLIELSPEDKGTIKDFCDAIRRFSKFDMPLGKPKELYSALDGIKLGSKMLPFMREMAKWSKISIWNFADRFKDPFLKHNFPLMFGLPDFPMLAAIFTLAEMHRKNAGYPIGGSLAFSQSIEKRYIELGGEIFYKSRVEKIIVENNHAVGVRLTDGSEHRADIVISAADGHSTIFNMLDGKYIDEDIRGYYDNLPIFQPIIQVSLGVARDMSYQPHSVLYQLDEPITMAGSAQDRIGIRHYCFDPTLAPSGKSVIVIIFWSNYDYWREFYKDIERYNNEKMQISNIVLEQLNKRFPGIKDEVEVIDVATPMTYERYTGNWQGSMEGWLITTKTMRMMMGKGMQKMLPGLNNFYMIGQWVEPGGGVPTSAMSGRNVMQIICNEDNKKFITNT